MIETSPKADVTPLHPQEPHPWDGIDIPEGYDLTPEGVYRRKSSDSERISGPIWVTANTRDHNGKEWGNVIEWIDRDGKPHSLAVPVRRLHETGPTLPQDLAGDGLLIVPGKERALVAYLGSFDPSQRIQCVTQLGWLENNQNQLSYIVPPDRVIGSESAEPIIFQPERHLPNIGSMHARGELSHWQNNVARLCKGNPFLIFSVCASLAPPLLRFAGLESGGFHFYGLSSTGKTTALQVAASVWGCGADPGASDNSHLRRWNSTANALEAVAAAHNDSLLVLDEMGSCDAFDFGKVVYDLFGGQGKSRMAKDTQLRQQRFWRLLALSSGEISVRERISQDKGKQAKAGHLVRLADIPVSERIIQDTHGRSAQDFVKMIKQNCAQYYGTAGPEFVQGLIDRFIDAQTLSDDIRQSVGFWTDSLAKGINLAPHQTRTLQRFALVLVAGLTASDLGILPIKTPDIKSAIESIRDAWLGSDLTEDLLGVNALREFIHVNQTQFGVTDDPGMRPRGMMGYRTIHLNRDLYLFTDEQFRMACNGHDPQAVVRKLRDLRYLHLNDANSGRLKSRFVIKEFSRSETRPWLYAVKSLLLEDE